MANSNKNIVITPNIGSTTVDPKIQFSGGNTTVDTNISMFVYPSSNGTLSFEGSAGQLFSITNDLSGSIFSVNDVSGIPSLEVFANGQINLAPYGGNVVFGNTSVITSSPIKINTSGTSSATRSLTIKDATTAEINFAAYAGAWTSSLQIQNNDNSDFIWMSPLDNGLNARIRTGGSGLDFYTDGSTDGGTYSAYIGSGSVRSPIFYDIDNTAYYVDPSSSTQSANLLGKVQLNGTPAVYLINQLIDARNVWEGTLNGYLLLAKAYVSGFQENSEVLGTVFISRGNTSAGNRQETIFVRSKSAYNAESFVASWPAGRDFSAGTLHKVTYNGTVYHAIRLAQSGGGPTQAFSFTGHAQNAGLIVALDSEVSNVSSYGYVLYETFTDGTFRAKTSFQAPIFYDSDNTSFYLDPASTTTSLQIAGAIEQGNNFAHPNIEWNASGSSTGMVIFSLPGVTPTNYGMLHMVFDIYEYASGKTATVIIAGHNWQNAWFETGCQVIGNFDKTVRLGVKDSKFCVVFGGAASTWTYGTIRLRKIHNGGFYNNIVDLGGAYTVAQTTTESFTSVTADLRQLRTPGTFQADGEVRSPIFYDSNNTAYYTDPASTSNLNGLTVAATISGKIQYVTEGMAPNADNYMNFRVMRNNNSSASNDGMYIGYGNTNSGLTRIFGGGAINGELIKYSNHTFEPGSFRAPIFYDSDNTGYYIDPNTISNINNLYIQGGVANPVASAQYYDAAIEVREFAFGGAQTDSWSYAPRIGFHWSGRTAAQIGMSSGARISILNADASGFAQLQSSNFYSPIFYDSDNTAFYADPASTSVFTSLNLTTLNGNPASELVWRSTSPYFYDNVLLTLNYYWVRVGRIGISGVNAYGTCQIEIECKTDYNFAQYVKGVVSFGIYNTAGATSISVQFDLFTPESINSYVAIDNNNDIWIKCDAQWGSYLRWRFIYKDAEVTVYESANWQKTLTTVPVTHTILRPGQTLRTTVGNVTAVAASSSSINRVGNLEVRTTGTAGTDFRAPIFYDSNNTNFYLDPASGSSLKRLFVDTTTVDPTEVNGVALGTINEPTTGWGAPGIAFGSGAGSHGAIGYGSGNMYFGSENGSDNTLNTRMSLTSGGILSVTTDVRAPIFYDTGNTAYYLDPASTSNLNGLTVAATITGTITNATTATSATTAGTVTTAAQPSITSVGTLTSLAVSGAITAGGDITAFSGSDRRLKTNIIKIDNALDKVNKISGITYDWNEEGKKSRQAEEEIFGNRREAGVIAQEIEEVLPEVVVTRKDGYKAVRYEKLVPLLIEAIKELSAKVEMLESKKEK